MDDTPGANAGTKKGYVVKYFAGSRWTIMVSCLEQGVLLGSFRCNGAVERAVGGGCWWTLVDVGGEEVS